MFSTMVLLVPTIVLPLMTNPTAECQFGRFGDPADDTRALVMFELAVEDYVSLHHRLERAWPPGWFLTDPEQAEMAAENMRAALRDARPQAAPGNVFTPEVADVFRFRIANALRHGTLAHMTTIWPPEGAEDADRWRPEINQPVPWGVSAARWPALSVLPPLPPELAYRFIGRDLVLVDVHANLVVDILDLALPTTAVIPDEEAPVPLPDDEFEGCRPE
jgi:hypothetical protein